MDMRCRQGAVFLSVLAALTILSMGCGLVARPVSTDTPAVLPSPIDIATPAPPQTAATYSGPFRLVAMVNDVLDGEPEALVSTSDGTLWLITEKGIARIAGTNLTAYLEEFTGRFAGMDSAGGAWVLSEDVTQISAWDGQSWAAYGTEMGWRVLEDEYHRYARGGQSDPQGRVWFATSQDVRAFDGGRWTVYSPQEMGMDPTGNEDAWTDFEVTVSSSGVVWVSECDWGGPGPFGGSGIRWFEQGAWQGDSSPVAFGCASAVAEDSAGNIWAGVEGSLWHYNTASGDWVEFPLPESPVDGMRTGFIDSLAVDPQEGVWPVVMLCGGASCFGTSVLYHFHDGKWAQVGEAGMYEAAYRAPVFDSTGTPWLYAEGGIYRVRNHLPELVSLLAGRFGASDQDGRVWIVASYDGREALWILEDGNGK